MKDWIRRIRGAFGMGLAWALGWGFAGGLIELLSNLGIHLPWFSLIDMWPQTLAIPGFLGGVIFSVVLRLAAGRQRFDELSVRRFGVWGAVAGALVGGLVLSTELLSGAFPSLLVRATVILAPFTLLSAASASGTLALARKATRRDPELLLEKE
jgi:hypothetical protein